VIILITKLWLSVALRSDPVQWSHNAASSKIVSSAPASSGLGLAYATSWLSTLRPKTKLSPTFGTRNFNKSEMRPFDVVRHFHEDRLLLHIGHNAMNAGARDDLVSCLDRGHQPLVVLLPLLLRANQQKVEDYEHPLELAYPALGQSASIVKGLLD
jgi:hypothetical protein